MKQLTWIKLKLEMFDSAKIKAIEKMPQGDTILIIWIKLLTLAGKKNDGGLIYLSKNVMYSTETLSAVLDREPMIVKMALDIFESFGMLEVFNTGEIAVINWEKHQNIDGLEKIREQNRKRQQEYKKRQRQKAALKEGKKVTLPVTEGDAIDIDIDIDNIYSQVVSLLNEKTSKNFREKTDSTRKLINGRIREGYKFEDFKKVIEVKCEEWLGTRFEDYLRPKTLFSPTNFENYINQKPKKQKDEILFDVLLTDDNEENYQLDFLKFKENYPAIYNSHVRFFKKSEYLEFVKYQSSSQLRIAFTPRQIKNKMNDFLKELNEHKYKRDTCNSIFQYIKTEFSKLIEVRA